MVVEFVVSMAGGCYLVQLAAMDVPGSCMMTALVSLAKKVAAKKGSMVSVKVVVVEMAAKSVAAVEMVRETCKKKERVVVCSPPHDSSAARPHRTSSALCR
jgi:hypothetical protein